MLAWKSIFRSVIYAVFTRQEHLLDRWFTSKDVKIGVILCNIIISDVHEVPLESSSVNTIIVFSARKKNTKVD